ncbi:cytochrome c maturation protein CcmE [Methylobacterium radiodurans]|uniref:Cytochrome c-type biogenesis protein CcmE n=1 Tax=Methylobacterium radiodurans TaxID=2202828 RepID=A0A2U8VN28_9HYPH|nr:cytochrome c maturation protein CcmE [Methylobacterium radiodurans]AWN35023.1 cytochrome c maturation protein CcmE [Methylobacterium radiodurans]
MTRKSRRLVLICVCGGVLVLAVGLILTAMSGSIVFFRSPSEVAAQGVGPGVRFRLGGLIEAGSVRRGPDQTVDFVVTDTNATVPVHYKGLLPDLFREGQGVVAEGRLEPGGLFRADTVLAKHDESYMPREVADALKAQGRWQEGGGKAAPDAKATPQATTATDKTLGPRSER